MSSRTDTVASATDRRSPSAPPYYGALTLADLTLKFGKPYKYKKDSNRHYDIWKVIDGLFEFLMFLSHAEMQQFVVCSFHRFTSTLNVRRVLCFLFSVKLSKWLVWWLRSPTPGLNNKYHSHVNITITILFGFHWSAAWNFKEKWSVFHSRGHGSLVYCSLLLR